MLSINMTVTARRPARNLRLLVEVLVGRLGESVAVDSRGDEEIWATGE